MDDFNELAVPAAQQWLFACCASSRWAGLVAAGRPYADLADVLAAADAATAWLDWSEVRDAANAHPRIGRPPAGGGREDHWSRREQSGLDGASAAARAAIADADAEYERRFGHRFLVCASGLDEAQLLAAVRSRLGNGLRTERGVVREELRKITALRLGRLFDEPA
ncbi:2-oxo-4-hydroxy-4-carboxy-5-ureidoimidazoline decarboxylase [Micromonospora marina]|uniref:2-oxo-4-hydroxy-4-carboxy-5-ureidoimidazoline decarboxylase n=1 Tax=Micromonospora marina TaxID=307120 RepID=UPI003454ED89